MYSINPLYTGEGTAIKLPELDALERSSRRANDLAIRGEEMKLERALKNKDEFVKMMRVNPVAAVAKKNQVAQAYLLEKYKNLGGEKYQKTQGGELSVTDELELQTEKEKIAAFQNKVLAEEKQLQGLMSKIQGDTRNYFDKDKFYKELETYLTSDDPNARLPYLTAAPQNIGVWLRQQSKTLPTTTNREERVDASGRKYYIDVTQTDEEKARNLIIEGMTDEAKMNYVIEDFDRWFKTASEDDKMKYLGDYDTDKNGKIDPTEAQYAYKNNDLTTNPIVKWAMDKYLPDAQYKDEGVSKNYNTGRSVSNKFDFKQPTTATHNQNDKFLVKDPTPIETSYGTFDLPDYMDFSSVSTEKKDANRKIKSYLVKNKDGVQTTQELNKLLSFEVVSYSPSSDIAIIKAKSEAGSVSAGELVPINGAEISDILSAEPFGVHRGNTQPTTQATSTTEAMSYVDYVKNNKGATHSDYKAYMDKLIKK